MRKILAIDGGGIKGVFSAAYLAELEKKLNGEKLYEYFDIIAGTSTGGIIAAAISLGIPASNILELYKSEGKTIFASKKRLLRLFSPTYDSYNLKRVLESVFEDKRISDCKGRLLIPSFNITTGRVRVFKTQHYEGIFFDGEMKIVDCLMATTAAPTYFSPYKGERGTYIDGGVGANNPSLIALIEALSKFQWKIDDIAILNVGGINTRPTNGNERMGLVDIRKIINCFMTSETQYSQKLCRQLLGKRYKSVDYLPSSVIGMDNVSNKALQELEVWGKQEAMHDIEGMKKYIFNERVETPVFYNQ